MVSIRAGRVVGCLTAALIATACTASPTTTATTSSTAPGTTIGHHTASSLPPGLLPATRSELLGRWVPAKLPKDERVASSYVFLSADGSWSGVDRCNNFEGKWDVGQQGAIDAVLSYISAVGCSTGVNFELWLTEATHAGFYGSTVVLVDAKGHVTGRFRRG